jgi:hypothetical protein
MHDRLPPFGLPGAGYASRMELDAARDAIVGVWKLFEYHDRETETDPWTPTFGRSPTGMLVYDRTGLLSAQVAADADDPTATFRYVGYFGTYVVREARREGDEMVGVVEHHMEFAYPHELLDEARPSVQDCWRSTNAGRWRWEPRKGRRPCRKTDHPGRA